MFKSIIAFIIVLLSVAQCCYALEKLTDDRGYMRNGKLEEYDRSMEGASKSGVNKRGFHGSPIYRDELEMGHSWEEQQASDDASESLYFYKDGTPKPGAFWTPEEEKAHKEEVERINKQWKAEMLAEQNAREAKLREQKRQEERVANAKNWLYKFWGVVYCVSVGILFFYNSALLKLNFWAMTCWLVILETLAPVVISLFVCLDPVGLVTTGFLLLYELVFFQDSLSFKSIKK